MAFWRFLLHHLALSGPGRPPPPVRVAASHLRESYAFLLVPWRLEQLLCHGFLICLDSFLFFFTFLPIRLLVAAGRLCANPFHPSKVLTAEVADDVFKAVLVAFVLTMLGLPDWTDYSTVYHFIRGESALKLYVLFGVLDVFDKLCCAFGQDVLDAVLFGFLYTDLHRVWCLLSFLGAALYAFWHCLVIFLQLITINVALNSENNALYTLLISSNFVELKSNVFRRCGKENLFQISCSDIVERFQIFLFLCILCVQNLRGGQYGGAQPIHIIMVCMCEILTDYIKHAFILKFNNLDAGLYSRFEQVICLDVLESRTAEQRHRVLGKWADGEGHTLRPTVSRRIGLVVIPSVALFTRACAEALPDILPLRTNVPFSAAVLSVGYIVLLILKVLTSILTVGHSCKIQARMAAAGLTAAPDPPPTPESVAPTPSRSDTQTRPADPPTKSTGDSHPFPSPRANSSTLSHDPLFPGRICSGRSSPHSVDPRPPPSPSVLASLLSGHAALRGAHLESQQSFRSLSGDIEADSDAVTAACLSDVECSILEERRTPDKPNPSLTPDSGPLPAALPPEFPVPSPVPPDPPSPPPPDIPRSHRPPIHRRRTLFPRPQCLEEDDLPPFDTGNGGPRATGDLRSGSAGSQR